jgi:hypothetical protein
MYQTEQEKGLLLTPSEKMLALITTLVISSEYVLVTLPDPVIQIGIETGRWECVFLGPVLIIIL